jgi:hypothetical protein
VVIRQIDRAALTKERNDLGAISNAIVMQIIRNKNIPDQNSWTNVAATWAMLSSSAISSNPRGYNRALLVDKSAWLGGSRLPFTQTNTGTTVPSSARMMILSSIGSTLPVTSGPIPVASFNDIWATSDGAVPLTWSGWSGSGGDLLIQRMNLEPLFHRLILFNRNTNVACSFGVDSTNQVSFATQWDSYYLDGSVVGLYTNGALALTEIINRDIGRVYEAGIWGDQIGPGPPSANQTNIDDIAYAFLSAKSAPPTGNGNNFRGDNTFGVADVLLSYMSAYSSWANMSTCFSTEGVSQGSVQQIPEYVLLQNVINCFGGGSGKGISSCTIVP